jgi:hypothetical protein
MSVAAPVWSPSSSSAMVRRSTWRWWFVYLCGLLSCGVVFKLARMTAPRPVSLMLVLLIALVGTWFVRPRLALEITVFLALIGDYVTAIWFPFVKNMSSHESLMFVSSAVNVSPLEVSLFGGFIAITLRGFAAGRQPFVLGRLGGWVLVFSAFVVIGLLHGIGTGGDSHIALVEARPLLDLPLVYLLVNTLCRTTAQARRVWWAALIGIVVHALFSAAYIATLSAAARDVPEGVLQHDSAVLFNIVLLLAIIVWVLHDVPTRFRVAITLAAVPVAYAYLAAQRRAAFIGLAVAMLMFAVVLFWQQRSTFWRLVPATLVLFAGYTVAFWNSPSGIAFPARALKTAISPGAVSVRDQGSDLYRIIENYDLVTTIQSTRLLGLGFGHAFFRPVELPDISFFEYYLYISHNSILWLWIQVGFLGFVAGLAFLVRTMILGGTSVREARRGPDLLVVLTAAAYVAMWVTFAFVDIAWNVQDMVMIGIAAAICGDYPARRAASRAAEPVTTSRSSGMVDPTLLAGTSAS